MKRAVFFVILVFVFTAIVVTACDSSSIRPVTPTPRSRGDASSGESSGESIKLLCQECADIGMEINIWSIPGGAAEGAKVVGSVPHNTSGTRLDRTTTDGRTWYKVRASGVLGWVLSEFVR